MSDFKERLNIELGELDVKLVKLKNFLGTTTFDDLPHVHAELLKQQAVAMQSYVSILEKRIALLG